MLFAATFEVGPVLAAVMFQIGIALINVLQTWLASRRRSTMETTLNNIEQKTVEVHTAVDAPNLPPVATGSK